MKYADAVATGVNLYIEVMSVWWSVFINKCFFKDQFLY